MQWKFLSTFEQLKVYKRSINNHIWSSCVFCDESVSSRPGVCDACYRDLPFIEHACAFCGMPFEGDWAVPCGRCQKQKNWFDGMFVPFLYCSPIDYLIRQFKFHENFALVTLATDLFLDRLQLTNENDKPDILVPVPLHKKRLKARGFNQAHLIAKRISKHTNIPICTNLVMKKTATRSQMKLAAKIRKQNIKNSFIVQHSVTNMHIAIVDDVVTTASTVNELARVLKAKGAYKIEVWALARTLNKS